MKGVVAGVRDYGNRMGIPTVNGAVYFDRRYLGNPLVYCGNAGLLPVDKAEKCPMAGDWIVAVGGRTGRDGIHGATFSSAELTSSSESISGGAVQIGNAVTEKMVLDVLIKARDEGLYSAVTDCGAGGFSSAVGEMGEEIGAEVWLERAPLKYDGLSYTEIWISEAQERMVMSVSPANLDRLQKLCQSEGVEATVIGQFVPTGQSAIDVRRQRSRRVIDGVPPWWPTSSGAQCDLRAANAYRHTNSVPRSSRHGNSIEANPWFVKRGQQTLDYSPVRSRSAIRQRDQAAGWSFVRRPRRCGRGASSLEQSTRCGDQLRNES